MHFVQPNNYPQKEQPESVKSQLHQAVLKVNRDDYARDS